MAGRWINMLGRGVGAALPAQTQGRALGIRDHRRGVLQPQVGLRWHQQGEGRCHTAPTPNDRAPGWRALMRLGVCGSGPGAVFTDHTDMRPPGMCYSVLGWSREGLQHPNRHWGRRAPEMRHPSYNFRPLWLDWSQQAAWGMAHVL